MGGKLFIFYKDRHMHLEAHFALIPLNKDPEYQT